MADVPVGVAPPRPREALWPLVSNTNRFNRDSGVPAVEREGPRRLEFRRYGVRVEWDEEPFEWVRPERFGVVRHYRHGPLREMKVRVTLDDEDGATRLHYDVDVLPHGVDRAPRRADRDRGARASTFRQGVRTLCTCGRGDGGAPATTGNARARRAGPARTRP